MNDYEKCEAYQIKKTVDGICIGNDGAKCEFCPAYLRYKVKIEQESGELGVNLINYNQAIEALDKERQLLLNREQYGAENVLVHHAINVIAELPIIRYPEIVHCKDCTYLNADTGICIVGIPHGHKDTFYCAYGKRR